MSSERKPEPVVPCPVCDPDVFIHARTLYMDLCGPHRTIVGSRMGDQTRPTSPLAAAEALRARARQVSASTDEVREAYKNYGRTLRIMSGVLTALRRLEIDEGELVDPDPMRVATMALVEARQEKPTEDEITDMVTSVLRIITDDRSVRSND